MSEDTVKIVTQMTKEMVSATKEDRKRVFIECLAVSGVVGIAATKAGIHRKTAYEWRKLDTNFAELWQHALEDAVDLVEDAAFTRAKDHSDRLVSLILRSHRREVYGEKVDITSGGVPISLSWPEGGREEEGGAQVE